MKMKRGVQQKHTTKHFCKMNESYRPNRSHNFSVNHGRNESRRDVLESLIKRESTG